MEDRRKSLRTELESTLLMERLDSKEKEEVDISIFDLSQTGLGFTCKEPLMIGAMYDVYLTIWTKEVLHACIEIVRSEKKEEAVFHYGATFVGMSGTDASRIAIYQTIQETGKE